MFEKKSVEKIKIHILYSITCCFENHTVYEVMWKGMLQPDRPQMTIKYGACTLHAGQITLQTHTQTM
jgi:hypothetical protein